MTDNDKLSMDDMMNENPGGDAKVRSFEVHIPEDVASLPEMGNDAGEAAEEYRRRPNNRGGGFTMRTEDDSDPRKIKSRQQEYHSRGEQAEIKDQISRLNEQLTTRAAVLLFTSVFSLFITIANDTGLTLAAMFDRTVNPSAYLFTNTLLGIISVGFSYSVVMMGVKSLLKGSPDSDTIASVNLIAAVISGIGALFDPETTKAAYFHIYTCAAITLMLFNTLGKLSVVRRTMRNFEFVSRTRSFAAVQQTDDEQTAAQLTNSPLGKTPELAYMKRTDFVRDFMKNSYSSDLSDLFAEKTSLLILAAAFAVGVMSFLFDKNAATLQDKIFVMLAAVSGTLSICSSFSLTLSANRPLAKASRKALDCSGVLLGYSSVEEYADIDSVLADAAQLFPTGQVEFADMKQLGTIAAEKAAVYAASLAEAGSSVTRPAFFKLLHGDTGMILPVKDCSYDNSGGISGVIENRRMLLGSRAMMEKHGIDGLPSEADEKSFADGNAVMYLAVSGKADMMFAVRLSAERAAAKWIQALTDENVTLHIRASDGFITRELIAELFGVDMPFVKLIPAAAGGAYEALTEPAKSVSASMLCTGHFSTFAMLLVAAKRVRFAANIGVAVQYGSMLLGIAVSVILMLMGVFSQLTPTIAVLYNLAFMLLTELLQSTKSI